MAILKQNQNVNTTYVGWYGKCGEPKCKNFDLTPYSSIISKVYQFTEDGLSTRVFTPNVAQSLNPFTDLKCGNVYAIELIRGGGEIEIKEFTHGHYSPNHKSMGMISNCITPLVENPKKDEDTIKPCTKDLRICPDGSSVGRDGMNDCNFPPCYFDKEMYKKMMESWASKQINHYKFDFKWSCYCTEEATKNVTLYVRYEKIYKIIETETEKEISLDDNEQNKLPFKYHSMKGLYNWISEELKKNPFSLQITYEEDMHYIKSAFLDKVQNMADEEIGFSVQNFEEIKITEKCPSDYKMCEDGSVLKRDPDNECKFPDCPEPTPKPPESTTTPKLKLRWMRTGNYEILQIKNLLNPMSTSDDDKYLSWRTVYGSRYTDPKKMSPSLKKYWKPAKVYFDYRNRHGDVVVLNELRINFDSENANQLTITLDATSEFLPNPDTIENVSHLYIFIRGKELSYTKSYSFPVIRKVSAKYADGVCPEDIKVCSDGTVLYRNEMNECEFDLCADEYPDETPFSIDEGYGDIPNTPSSENLICPQDVKMCEDGTYRSRNPFENCTFGLCPEEMNDDENGEEIIDSDSEQDTINEDEPENDYMDINDTSSDDNNYDSSSDDIIEFGSDDYTSEYTDDIIEFPEN